MSVIDKLAPFKTKRVKINSQEWFHGEVLESYALQMEGWKPLTITTKRSSWMLYQLQICLCIALRDKLFTKFKLSKFNVDKEIYNEAHKSHRFILQQKECFENKIKKNIAKLKDIWKTLKSLGLSKKNFQLFKQMQLQIINVYNTA